MTSADVPWPPVPVLGWWLLPVGLGGWLLADPRPFPSPPACLLWSGSLQSRRTQRVRAPAPPLPCGVSFAHAVPALLLCAWPLPKGSPHSFCCAGASIHTTGPEDPCPPACTLSPEPRQLAENTPQVLARPSLPLHCRGVTHARKGHPGWVLPLHWRAGVSQLLWNPVGFHGSRGRAHEGPRKRARSSEVRLGQGLQPEG